MQLYEFPFASVRRDANVIIYGAGVVGQTYLRQVSMTQYCRIEALVDRNYIRYKGLPFRVEPVEAIPTLAYEIVVIANDSPTIAAEIKQMLIHEYNIPLEKIIYERRYIAPTTFISDTDKFLPAKELAFSQPHKYSIAIKLDGGLGDYIIRKNNIREVADWDTSILIDLYVNNGKKAFAENLFCDVSNIHRIIDNHTEYQAMQDKYLASFYFDIMLRVDFIDMEAVQDIPPNIREKLIKIKENYTAYGMAEGNLLYAIHYARCEKDGLNCYTAYNRYQVFHVTDFRTSIPLRAEWADEFESLDLHRYITLNYGWDKSSGSVRPAAKAWPLEYFSELAGMIKAKYPYVSVIQIGMEGSEKIENCDHYILGKNLELIKFVLRDSMMHIDCEGGMVHLASQLGTKCAVMFGPTPVKYYGYATNLNIISSTCQNCYWLMPDCISCYRGMEKPECMYSILPRTVLESIETFL